MQKGLIHIYTGDGKGKTTAALGLMLRASGAGMKVVIARFLKKNDSAEINAISGLKNIILIPNEHEYGFFLSKEKLEKAMPEIRPYYTNMLKMAIESAVSKEADLLILDEIIAATRKEIVDVKILTDFLKNKPEKLEVVMTGRQPLAELTELADYISEIKKVKHPIDNGIRARKGIEF